MQNRNDYDYKMKPDTGEIECSHNGKQVEKNKEERKKDTAIYPINTYSGNIDMEMHDDGRVDYYDKDGFPLNNKTKKKKKDN